MSEFDQDTSPEALRIAVLSWLDTYWDSDNRHPLNEPAYDRRRWRQQVLEAGLAVPSWPPEWFGLGMTAAQCKVIEKAFAERNASGTSLDRYHLGAITVFRAGSDALKREMLPELLTGPICCLLYSEPNAGSDLAGIRTRAEREGDKYVINGQKVWTSNAREADYGMLLARTDWDAPKHRGITFFLFPMRQAGVEIRPINQITGESEFNEIFIENALVPERFMIGNLNEGWGSFQTAIAYERLIMGQGITGRRRSSEARGRPPLLELAEKNDRLNDPVVRQRLAQALAYREVNSLNNERAMTQMMTQGSMSLMSLSKLAMSRIQHGEAAIATDILGPKALLDGPDNSDAANTNFDAAKAYMNSIGGGTDQIQRNIIAEKVLGLPKEHEPDKGIAFREVKSGTGSGTTG